MIMYMRLKKILKNTDRKDRHLINQLLKYPDNSAGSIMTTEYVDFQKNMTVQEAIGQLKKTGKDKENIYYAFNKQQHEYNKKYRYGRFIEGSRTVNLNF